MDDTTDCASVRTLGGTALTILAGGLAMGLEMLLLPEFAVPPGLSSGLSLITIAEASRLLTAAGGSPTGDPTLDAVVLPIFQGAEAALAFCCIGIIAALLASVVKLQQPGEEWYLKSHIWFLVAGVCGFAPLGYGLGLSYAFGLGVAFGAGWLMIAFGFGFALIEYAEAQSKSEEESLVLTSMDGEEAKPASDVEQQTGSSNHSNAQGAFNAIALAAFIIVGSAVGVVVWYFLKTDPVDPTNGTGTLPPAMG